MALPCISKAALVYSLLLASAFIEISRTCEGKKLRRIVDVLEEIKDWKKLAMQLDMKPGVINNLGRLDEMVSRFCDSQGDVPVEDVVAIIAKALREIGYVKQADILKKMFPRGTVITTGIPSPPPTMKPPVVPTVSSDSSSPTTRPLPHEGSTPPPSSKPPHIHELSSFECIKQYSLIECIKQYLIDLTTGAIVIGGVVSLVLAMLLHYFCSKYKTTPPPPSADSPPSKAREKRPPPTASATREKQPPPSTSAQHDSKLRRRKVDEPWRKDTLTFDKLQLITYNEDKKLRIMQRAQKEWHKIGTELGIEPAVLSGIESVGHGDLDRQCRDVFMKWLSTGSRKYKLTWQGLLDLLEAVNLNPLAEEVDIALRSNYSV